MRTDVKPGEDVMVFAKNKWQPAKLVEMGRKWAKVGLNGKSYFTKVPATAVKALTIEQAQHAHTKVEEAPKEAVAVVVLVEEEHYIKIKQGGNTIGIFIKRYRKEAQAAFEAIRTQS